MNEPLRFRSRPVVVEAMQWTGANTEAVIKWAESTSLAHVFTLGDDERSLYLGAKPPLAEVGDWIIRGPSGELWPCKPMRFARDYVEVIGAVTSFDELAEGHP